MRAAIIGLSGHALTPDDLRLLRTHAPAGVILFARNIAAPDQARALTHHLRRLLPPAVVIMVDQEGGRVARLRPPHWHAHPPAARLGALFARDRRAGLRAAWLTGALIGLDCADTGFDLVAAPVLDLSFPGAHDVIGDRAFSADPQAVARLGRAVADGLAAGGVMAVGKHAPGHGRAREDSHLDLPVVDANDLDTDCLPFAANTDLPWLMTAHIVYAAFDATAPATLSPAVIQGVIRDRMGFNGMVVSDDLAMRALRGDPPDNARAALAAGCDLALYCPGDSQGNTAVLSACPAVAPATMARLVTARARVRARRLILNPAALAAERDRLLA